MLSNSPNMNSQPSTSSVRITPQNPQHVGFFLPSLVGGGAERVFLTLAEGFLNRDVQVDVVVGGSHGDLVDQVDRRACTVDLGKSRLLSALPGLVRYLKSRKPQVLLSALTHTNLVAIWARKLAGCQTRLILTEHLSLQVEAGLKDRMLYPLAGLFYPSADAVIAVSEGVAMDLKKLLGSKAAVKVIHNPVNLDRISVLSKEEPAHPWLQDKDRPVLLAVGRLHPNKDYPTLLKAFSILQSQFPCRLIILGQGEELSMLADEISRMHLTHLVSLPGFVENPYAFMRRADVFVLSSVFEGLPTVLIEALACGATIVSTNCPSGPAEILANGEFGSLVPVKQPAILAEAVSQALAEPIQPLKALRRAGEFDIGHITERYLEMIRQVMQGVSDHDGG
jgi:glycosyltransferase involved in cell wall biosynthesis